MPKKGIEEAIEQSGVRLAGGDAGIEGFFPQPRRVKKITRRGKRK